MSRTWWVCEWCYPKHPDQYLVESRPEICRVRFCTVQKVETWHFPTPIEPRQEYAPDAGERREPLTDPRLDGLAAAIDWPGMAGCTAEERTERWRAHPYFERDRAVRYVKALGALAWLLGRHPTEEDLARLGEGCFGGTGPQEQAEACATPAEPEAER